MKANVIKADLYKKDSDKNEMYDFGYNLSSIRNAGFYLDNSYTFDTMQEYKLFNYALQNAAEWLGSTYIDPVNIEDVRPFIDPKMLALAEQKPFVGYYAFGKDAVSQEKCGYFEKIWSCDGMFCAWGFDTEGERDSFDCGLCLEDDEEYVVWVKNKVDVETFDSAKGEAILKNFCSLEDKWDRVEVIDGVPYLKPE